LSEDNLYHRKLLCIFKKKKMNVICDTDNLSHYVKEAIYQLF